MKYKDKFESRRIAKDRKRLFSPAPEYPAILPSLRKIIIVINYDSGREVWFKYDLFKTASVVQYGIYHSGRRLKLGLSRILELIRKDNPPVKSPYTI